MTADHLDVIAMVDLRLIQPGQTDTIGARSVPAVWAVNAVSAEILRIGAGTDPMDPIDILPEKAGQAMVDHVHDLHPAVMDLTAVLNLHRRAIMAMVICREVISPEDPWMIGVHQIDQ